jgi:hypothetical protein
MATMSEAMHRYVEGKLTSAADLIGNARDSIPAPTEYKNFDRALAVIEECRNALTSVMDVDIVAQVLRDAAGELGHFCGGPAEAGVNAAIELIGQAIGGETM